MNEQNYCTLEAAQRLDAKGIVLETEAAWCEYGPGDWSIGYRGLIEDDPKKRPFIPAPSMAEVWRELPDGCIAYKGIFHTEAYRKFGAQESKMNTNPTDALIDLLIFVVEQKGKEEV